MRVTGHHWAVLLDFCERNPQIITNKYAGAHSGRDEHKKLWEQLATMLNSLGYGEKSIEEWKKALTDWKSKTKSKAANLKKSQSKTGGGPSSIPILTDYEERLLCLMGKTAVDGNPTVKEIGIPSIKNSMQQIQSTSSTVNNIQLLNANAFSMQPTQPTFSPVDEIQMMNANKYNDLTNSQSSIEVQIQNMINSENTQFFLDNSSPSQLESIVSNTVVNSTCKTPEQLNLKTKAKRPRKQLEYSKNTTVYEEPTESNLKHKIPKKQGEDKQLKQMNDQILEVLNEMNANLFAINENFARLLDVLEKQSH